MGLPMTSNRSCDSSPRISENLSFYKPPVNSMYELVIDEALRLGSAKHRVILSTYDASTTHEPLWFLRLIDLEFSQ